MKLRKRTIILAVIALLLLVPGTATAQGYDRYVLPDPNGGTVYVFTKGMSPSLARILKDIYKDSSFPWQSIIRPPATPPAPVVPPTRPVPKPPVTPNPPVTPPAPPAPPVTPKPPAPPPVTPPTPPAPPVTPPVPADPSETPKAEGLTEKEQQMLDLVNQERAKVGARALVADMRLVAQARLKSQDMIDKKYFAHESPTYGSPFDQMKSAGITYRTAGENLAGAPSVQSAHTNLMASDGHRRNILNPEFTHIGIGIVEGGPYGMMFTQMFIGN